MKWMNRISKDANDSEYINPFKMDRLQELMNDIAKWSDDTFGMDDRRLGMLAHLLKEIDELRDDISVNATETRFEIADCLMLLLDIASHTGISANMLLFDCEQKLRINKTRKWGKANPDGSIEHIKDGQ